MTRSRWTGSVLVLAATAYGCSPEDKDPGREGSDEAEAVMCAAPPPPPAVLTFSYRLASKLFINNIGIGDCIASTGIVPVLMGIPGFDQARQAAFFAFCRATSLGENPPSDANVAPLDARILSIGTGSWQCRAGQAAPFGGNFRGGGSVGGPEGPLVGIANAPAVRDQINANGSFGLVSSGRPNPLAEPAFQGFRPRLRADIWNKVTAQITCGVDARGMPTANLNLNAWFTRFPSHKIWRRTPANAAATRLLFNRPQGSFSNLWWLPAIPAP
jgi:hypothetical protein